MLRKPTALLRHTVTFTKLPLSALETPHRERVREGLRMRLHMLRPVAGTWAQALALLASPGAAPRTLQLYTQLADTIWHAAGDTSTDLSWCVGRGWGATWADAACPQSSGGCGAAGDASTGRFGSLPVSPPQPPRCASRRLMTPPAVPRPTATTPAVPRQAATAPISP